MMSEAQLTLSNLSEKQRSQALERFKIIQPFLEGEVSLKEAIRDQGISLRAAQRWVKRYKELGFVGLARLSRHDKGTGKVVSAELRQIIEGLICKFPHRSIASIHQRIVEYCQKKEISSPSYSAVYAVAAAIEPSMLMLAHEGTKAYKQEFDLLFRREATEPNAIWQADHTRLDIWTENEKGEPQRAWLTVIIDDFSRAIAGYLISFAAPSALNTALALRQAIWRKGSSDWQICGIPQILYTDHGSDFTSQHIEQVCADLKIHLIFSQVGQPRGRGKIERFFRTVNEELLSCLSGYKNQKAKNLLTLEELGGLFEQFLANYHQRPHSETKIAPLSRWKNKGFIPQMPDSLEALDLLLLTVRKTRRIHRDGIKFQGLRYIDPLLASYIGEDVSIRYDPRDITEIRVFFEDKFLCRAICQDLAAETVSLKEIVTARNRRRKQLKKEIEQRISLVDALLEMKRPTQTKAIPQPQFLPPDSEPKKTSKTKLKLYVHD